MLRIAVQAKGRLFEETLALLEESDIKLSTTKRTLLVKSSNFPLEVLFLRDDDIPQTVATGVADLGIVGENEWMEKQEEVRVVKRLGFSKCRLSLAMPRDLEYTGLSWFEGKKIATSYPVILRRFLDEKGIQAEIHVISGSVEVAPGIGLADAIFDIVSSGSTLVSNRLKEVEVVMQSEALLIAHKELNVEKEEILGELLFRMNAVKTAEDKKYVLMLAVPAQIAGCREIVLCTPPDQTGGVHPAILFAAQLADVSRIYKVGGAQAIAAMAYGTESIPRVYKIFGPGNQYVTAAKQLVSLHGVAIDMPAGPSEVVVLADETAQPSFVAADLLSQAEHGVDSQVLLVTPSQRLQQAVKEEVEKQLAVLPRREIAACALANSRLIQVRNLDEAVRLVNAYAPEHLIIETAHYREVAEQITHAGSVFLGSLTPESAGDYASGTNHTLPTNGYARAYSGVSLDSFIRKITFQEIQAEGIQAIGPAIEEMAVSEQLEAHKNAVTVRLNALKQLKQERK